MKNKLIFSFLILSGLQLLAQDYCIPNRFVDNYYFRSRDIQWDKDMVYGQAANYKGKIKTLDLDLYYPKPLVDPLEKKPLIMLIHGGSRGDKAKMQKYCPLFAQRGFVVANINRRKGRRNNEELEVLKEAYRALQDSHAALRFLVHQAEKYGIDTTAVFIGGVSAGALMSTGIGYLEQTFFDMRYPLVTQSLGRVDNATNDLNTRFTVKGVINMWGQVADTAFISPEEAKTIPIIMFHGTADSSKSTYEKSLHIAKRFQNLDGCYQLHTKPGGRHASDISKYYIAQQTGCFIKRIFCDSCVTFEREVNNEDPACRNMLPIDKIPSSRSHIRLEPSVLKTYCGTYKTKGKSKSKLLILEEKGNLFIQDENGRFKAELHAENEHDFFIEEDNMQFSFHRNTKGQVSGMTFYIDAIEIVAKKIR